MVFWPFCDLSYNQQSIEVNSGAALDSLSPIFLDDAQQPTVHSKRVQCLEMNHYRIDLGQPRAIFPRQLQISSPIVNQLWLIFKRIFIAFFSFDTCQFSTAFLPFLGRFSILVFSLIFSSLFGLSLYLIFLFVFHFLTSTTSFGHN